MIATDVLSEGQNLQDAAIVVNYDLPWAIIRLIQRAGRVDRIGQQADAIYCYTFLPVTASNGLSDSESAVKQRLKENAEVVGTDEAFFVGDMDSQTIHDLYNERSGISRCRGRYRNRPCIPSVPNLEERDRCRSQAKGYY